VARVGQICLAPDLGGKVLNFLLSSKIFSVDLSYVGFNMLRFIPSTTNLLGFF
jgi:hypothetical protein